MNDAAADTDSGVYRLWIELASPVDVRAGRLGIFRLPAGTYVYVGSARRGLSARLARHRRSRKKRHWHIDHLLAMRQASIRRVEVRPWRVGAECRWARRTRTEGGRVMIAGFGASDCRSRCGAHLFLMPGRRVG